MCKRSQIYGWVLSTTLGLVKTDGFQNIVPVCLQIPGSEKILEVASGADRGNKFADLLKKTGLTKAAMSSFGEPELLDDLVDHWNAGNHKEVYVRFCCVDRLTSRSAKCVMLYV